MTNLRLVAALVMAASVLSACGGGSHSAGSVPALGASPVSAGPDLSAAAPHNAGPAPGAVAANVSVSIPLPLQPSSTKRAPRYLTSYTKGLDLQAYQNGTYSGYVFYPLSALQSYCSVTGSTYSCNLSVQAPVGSGQIIVHTYDNTTVATSNMLSVATQNVTIAPNQANTIAIATLPIAASLVPGGTFPRCPVYGSPATTTVSYTAYDADGGALTGLALGNSLAFVNVNPADSPSGHSWSPAAISAGSGSDTYSYNGSDANAGVFNLTSSLTPSGATNAVLSTVGITPVGSAGPHMVYVSDAANNQIIGVDACSGTVSNYTNLPAGTNPKEVKFDRNSSAADPRLFVVGQNNSLVWLDVQSSPGTQVRVIGFGGAVQHVNDSSVSPYMWLTAGVNQFKQYMVNEGAQTLTVSASIGSLVNPKGFGLEGAGNDILLAASGAGSILAMNPSTLGTDAAVNVGGTPTKVSGPNGPTPSCALAADPTNNLVEAISVGATPATGTVQIGTSLSVPGSPVALAFFPPGTPGSGTIGIGSTTGIVALAAGGAQLITCTGSSFASSTFWQTFPTNPAAMVTSVYSSTAISSLVYVVGLDNGVPSLQAFTSSLDHNLGSQTLTGTTTPNPTDVTAGP